jgi:uncharacterized protein (TIGR02145 family)
MKKTKLLLGVILVFLFSFSSLVLKAQIPAAIDIKMKSDNMRNFQVEEIKVRWKKAALENCPGVPCVSNSTPGAPTAVIATAGNASASIAFLAPSNNGGSMITGYTVTSNPGGITGTGSGSPITVTGLTNGTSYTFTVVATNSVGSSVASSASTAVTPSLPACGLITNVSDRESNSYPVVSIGTQCWMASNLRVTTYNNGATIPEINSSQPWNSTIVTGARTIYNDASTNLTDYGYLYNWYAAKGISVTTVIPSTDTLNICPLGWHVPNDSEWTTLITYLGGTNIAGGKMKTTGTSFWTSESVGTDNSSGFSGLPAGYRSANDGLYYLIGMRTFFWSATIYGGNDAWTFGLGGSTNSALKLNIDGKSSGASVRCLKD